MKPSENSSIQKRILVVLLVWIGGLIPASESGWLGSLSPFSPPLIAGATILVPVLCYFLMPTLRAYLGTLGLRRLTALHILRIVAVPVFFWYGNRNLLPQSFVQAAGWGDLAAGLLALTVVLFWTQRAGYWTVHILGMVDFIVAFGLAIRLTIADPGVMHAITGLPMVLIPFFGVGVLATSHVIAYDLLLHRQGVEPQAELRLNTAEVR